MNKALLLGILCICLFFLPSYAHEPLPYNKITWEVNTAVTVRQLDILKQLLAADSLKAGIGFDELRIVRAGGESEAGLQTTVSLLRWNTARQEWKKETLPALPVVLKKPGVLLYENKVYVAGGTTTTGPADGMYMLDLQQPDAWKPMPPMPVPSIYPQLLVQSNGEYPCIYVLGEQPGRNMMIYDLSKGIWTVAPLRDDAGLLPAAPLSGIATGSTYLLFAPGSLAVSDSSYRQLWMYNTITKRMSIAGSSRFMSGRNYLLKDEGQLWLASQNEQGGFTLYKGTIVYPGFFSIWDYAVLAAYLLFTVFIGLAFAGKQQSTADYFKGGGKVPGWAVGVSILGSHLSAITFMSVPAKTYATNWNYFFLMMSVILVVPLVNRYFIPFYRRLNITSAYEYLDKRFNYKVRFIASLLYIVLQLGRLAIVLLLPSIALTVITGIDVNVCILLMGVVTVFYTFKGGIKAVIWTDVIQVFVLLGGAFLCVLYIPTKLPADAATIYQHITDNGKFRMFDGTFDLSTPNFWVVFIGGWTLNFILFSSDQTTVQRYLTTKDEATAKQSARIGAWITIPAGLIFLSIGTLLYLFYYYHPEKVNISLDKQDSIFPWYIVSELPVGVTGLLIAGIFAAAMSTLSSSLNSVSTAFITDFYKVLFTQKTDLRYLRAAKVTTALVGMLSTGLALFMAHRGVVSLWDQFNTILGLFTGGIGGVFLLGIFTKRANAAGAIGGLLVSGIGQYFINKYTPLNFLLYAFTGLIICFVTGWLISICFPGSQKNTAGLTAMSTLKEESVLV